MKGTAVTGARFATGSNVVEADLQISFPRHRDWLLMADRTQRPPAASEEPGYCPDSSESTLPSFLAIVGTPTGASVPSRSNSTIVIEGCLREQMREVRNVMVRDLTVRHASKRAIRGYLTSRPGLRSRIANVPVGN